MQNQAFVKKFQPFMSSENSKFKQSDNQGTPLFGSFYVHNLIMHVFCIINWKDFFLSNYLQICAEIYFYFADQKVVTENPIRTTRFASITTPLPVRKNDKFSDSGEGLVYDLGNFIFVQNFINLCLIHLLVQKKLVAFKIC